MQITLISDTHNQHLSIPKDLITGGDCIIHAGDVSGRGSKTEVEDFLAWYNELPFTYKIMIAGNHDFFFEEAPEYAINTLLDKYPNIIYLNDSGVEIEGLKIWGSPVQPWFYNWAFNKKDKEIIPHWDMIPLDTNILVCHGGPKNIGTLNVTNRELEDVGCPYLYEKISEMTDLKLFVQGHIHEGRGFYKFADGALFINASVLDLKYRIANNPFVIDTENWEIIKS